MFLEKQVKTDFKKLRLIFLFHEGPMNSYAFSHFCCNSDESAASHQTCSTEYSEF